MEEIKAELEKVETGAEGLMQEIEEKAEGLMEKIEAEGIKLMKRIEKITAEAEDGGSHPSRIERAKNGAPELSSSRKTMNSFVEKAMAAAEGAGHDAKQIDAMLYGLSIEQRMAVKMQMVKAGIL